MTPSPENRALDDAADLRALIDASPIGLCRIEQRRFTVVSHAVEKITGYDAKELIGRSTRLLYFSDAEHLAAGQEISDQITRLGRFRLEVRLRRRDDAELWVRMSGQPVDPADPEAGICLLAEDITAQRRNAAELETVLNAAPMAIAHVVDRRFVWVNPACEALMGYTAAEIRGYGTRLFYESDEAFEAFGRQYYPAILAGETIRTELVQITRDDRRLLCEISGRALESGHPERGAIFIYRDITEQRRMEQNLREREARLQLLLDSTAEGIYGLDVNGICILCNKACLRMLGYAHESELLGRQIHNIIHHTKPDGTPHPLEECKAYAAFRRGVPMHTDDEVFWRANGTSFPVEYWSYPMHVEGAVVGSVVTFLDISERKAAETALHAGKRRLEALLDSIPDMAWLKDAQGRFLAINKPAAIYCGGGQSDIVGRIDSEVFSEADAKRKRANDVRVMETLKPHRFDEQMTDREGRTRWLEIIKVPIFEEDGKVAGTAGIARDITDRHDMEARIQAQAEKLAAQNALLIKANRAKSDFLSTMQHELKTPLNAIIGFSELLVQGVPQPLPQEQLSFAQDIFDAGRHLLELINEILIYTRGEAGELALHPEAVETQAFLNGRANAYRDTAAAKSIALQLSIEPECGSFLADRQYLRVIIDNLVSNALKFTPAGGQIAITARLASGPECDGARGCSRAGTATCERCILISVSDTGIGIDPKEVHRLFQPFIQLKSGLARPAGGTGLGLALARRLAELHGGTLNYQSTQTKGSTFILMLPWHPMPEAGPEENNS